MAKSPDAFRTISEVAEWLDTQPHVLRFWESKFTQVKPVKRAGGRRYYRPNDMLLLGGIKKLLHEDGMTIKGVQKILREQGIRYVSDLSPELEDWAATEIMPDLPASAAIPQPMPEETGTILPFHGRGQREDPAPEPVTEAATPEPALEPAPEAEPPTPEADTEVEDEIAAEAVPEFEDEEEAPAPEPTPQPARPGDDRMPAFIRRSPTGARPPAEEDAPAADETPVEAQPVAASALEDEAEPDQPMLVPRRITVPDDPDDSEAAAPGLLSDISRSGPLASGGIGEIAALLERLESWRNNLADRASK